MLSQPAFIYNYYNYYQPNYITYRNPSPNYYSFMPYADFNSIVAQIQQSIKEIKNMPVAVVGNQTVKPNQTQNVGNNRTNLVSAPKDI